MYALVTMFNLGTLETVKYLIIPNLRLDNNGPALLDCAITGSYFLVFAIVGLVLFSRKVK